MSKEEPCVIASIDKDLYQAEGLHYNFVKKEWREVSRIEGTRQLYLQLLIGDTSDNVKGVMGIGPVKAGKLLNHIDGEYQMFEVVRDLYNDDERLLKNGQLLYIRRYDDEIWNFPSKQVKPMSQGGGPVRLSIPLMPREPTQYTEPTGLVRAGT